MSIGENALGHFSCALTITNGARKNPVPQNAGIVMPPALAAFKAQIVALLQQDAAIPPYQVLCLRRPVLRRCNGLVRLTGLPARTIGGSRAKRRFSSARSQGFPDRVYPFEVDRVP
jgi:hypothetical protein